MTFWWTSHRRLFPFLVSEAEGKAKGGDEGEA
jgi:hypothetical protein